MGERAGGRHFFVPWVTASARRSAPGRIRTGNHPLPQPPWRHDGSGRGTLYPLSYEGSPQGNHPRAVAQVVREERSASVTSSVRCIYCMVEKSAADFNRDHVIPEAFGLFEGNFVLACVCTACNQFFGDTVELKLARDSIEAHDRVRVGLKDARQFQALGKRSTTYVEFGTDSPAPGAHGYLVPPKEGPDLAVTVKPRVGFGHSADGPFDWRPIDQLPTKDELAALGVRKGEPLYMQTQGEAPIEEFQSALATKGIPFSVTSEVPPPAGAAHVEVVYTLARPEFRALTKIALNYLAAVAGSDVAREPWFHQARRFARYDEGKNPVK